MKIKIELDVEDDLNLRDIQWMVQEEVVKIWEEYRKNNQIQYTLNKDNNTVTVSLGK
jgi:hypothetical protein